jgi:hypothetical protein
VYDRRYLVPILEVLKACGAPFVVNVYPFLTYDQDQRDEIPLTYALMDPAAPVDIDTATGHAYHTVRVRGMRGRAASLTSCGAGSVCLILLVSAPTAEQRKSGASSRMLLTWRCLYVTKLVRGAASRCAAAVRRAARHRAMGAIQQYPCDTPAL